MKDQKTPEEILKKHILQAQVDEGNPITDEQWRESISDEAGKMFHQAFLAAMQEYAQTISEGKDREIEELREALTEISNLCGTTNLSSQNQMREAIKGAVEITDTALNKVH